jgi:hypothetical protein
MSPTMREVEEEIERLELLLAEVRKTADRYVHALGIPTSVRRTQVLSIARRIRRLQAEIDRELRSLSGLYS